MSKFNKNMPGAERAVSYEGNVQFAKNPVEDWCNFIMSSMLENRFYESVEDQMERYINLTNQIGEELGWEFVAKAAIFARNELGMRSISELTAAILNEHTFDRKRQFFANYFHRPDGVSEVFAAIDSLGGKRSHALVRGAADYLSTLKDYSIDKYKMNGKVYNMYDLINITHAHSAAIDRYKNDCLEKADTWEKAISASENKEEKNQEWQRLVEEHKLGYLALIRNLRNIVDTKPSESWVREHLTMQIENSIAIKKSLVMPYQIYCAYKNIGIRNTAIDIALERAFRIACGNMPELPGDSVVVLDVSGSMDSCWSANSSLTIKEVGAVYGAALLIHSGADFIKFGNYAKIKTYNPLENIFNIIEDMQENEVCGYGTNAASAYGAMQKRYDRIFLISDMQTMSVSDGRYYAGYGVRSYNSYCDNFNCSPHVYSFDLSNYPSQIENPNNPKIHLLTALSDKFFTLIKFIEDGGSLVDYINENYSY